MPRRSGFFQHAGEAAVGDEPHERDGNVNRAGNPCAEERQWNGEGRGKFEIQNPKHETSLKSTMFETQAIAVGWNLLNSDLIRVSRFGFNRGFVVLGE
jgi:hypothetical protein